MTRMQKIARNHTSPRRRRAGLAAGLLLAVLSISTQGLEAQERNAVQLYPLPGFVPLFEKGYLDLYWSPGDSTLKISNSPFRLPQNWFVRDVRVDSTGSNFIFRNLYKRQDLQSPQIIPYRDFFEAAAEQNLRNLWKQKIAEVIKREAARRKGGRIEIVGGTIAGQDVALRVSGNINIRGGVRNDNRSQVALNRNESQNTSFKLDQKQQFNIEGTIGDKISVLVDQDSERDFDFENALKIHYVGGEDEIVKKVDAGNINLSLPGTNFAVPGGASRGLFGIKSLAKLGGLEVTSIASVERGKKEKLTLEGGATSQSTEISDHNFRRNIYFFLDDTYRNSLYPLRNGIRIIPTGKKIASVELYLSALQNETGIIVGTAVPDPADTSQLANPAEYGGEEAPFRRLEPGVDYEVDPNFGYVRLNFALTQSDILAAEYSDESGRRVGGDLFESGGDTLMALKLVKKRNQRPSDPTWNLEFKNVYYLGATGINEEGFELKIVYTDVGGDPQERLNGVNLLQIFGLDSTDVNGTRGVQDEIIDLQGGAFVNFARGELWFPSLEPFSGKAGPIGAEGLPDTLGSPVFYSSTDLDSIRSASKFKIVASYKNRSSVLSLGFNVIEGSEEVRLNGVILNRGSDYTIDYFTGTLTLLKDEATDPGANLDVKYEKNQLFLLDKKALLGTRAEYRFNENSFLGSTFLYFSKSTLDQKVRVGEEPLRNMLWDFNGKMRASPDFLTRAVDALPLVQTDQRSEFSIEGEIAQIIPNPNTLNNDRTGDTEGVAYLDDFESSKRTTPLTITRRHWTPASPPEGMPDASRAFTYWYNPYGRVNVNDIWENRDTDSKRGVGGAGGNLTDVLTIVLDPENNKLDIPDESIAPENRWGGVMRALSPGFFDQSKTKFLEIWIKGDEGMVNIDLGLISEDMDGDGKLDTEDKPEGGAFGNERTDPDEDVGIDGCSDEYETGDPLNPCSDTPLNLGDDPNNDNWNFSENVQDYRRINGTENNLNDEAGYIPDTEDLNRNTIPDFREGYFEYSFWLDGRDAHLIAGGPNKKGWTLYRLPLSNWTKKTSPDVNFQDIQYVRMWLTGLSAENGVQIATIELVGNEWQELGVKSEFSEEFDKKDSSFAITVVNTEDNSDFYDGKRINGDPFAQPPPGVEGEEDRVTGLRAKEQSLVLKMSDLSPGAVGAARKVYFNDQDIANYKRMKMFVHGDRHFGTDTSTVQFFLRFGKSDQSYYEISQPVYAGWDERNEIDIDLKLLPQVKLQPGNELSLGAGKKLRAVNNPSITRISQLVVGVKNNHSVKPLSGEIWVDELRVSGVGKEKGMAARVSSDLKIADLGRVNFNARRMDAEFHDVQGKRGKANSLNNTRNYNIQGSLNLNKFLPARWGLGIPINARYENVRSAPKYMPGTDIQIIGVVPDTVLNTSEKRTLGTSFRKNSKSRRRLLKYTLDKMNFGLNYVNNQSQNTQLAMNKSITYKGDFKYTMPLKRTRNFKIFSWLKPMPWLGKKMANMKLYYLPNSFSWNLTATESKTKRKPRRGVESESYRFDMNRSLRTGVQPFDGLTMNYNQSWKNDLFRLRGNKSNVLNGDFGRLNSMTQQFNNNVNPKIFRFLTTSFGYNTTYNYSDNKNDTGNSISNQNQFSANLKFNTKTFLSIFSEKKKPKKPGKRAGRRKKIKSKKEVSQKPTIVDLLRGLTGKLQPITVTFTRQRQTRNPVTRGSPNLYYILGITRAPGNTRTEGIAAEVTTSQTKNYSVRSGLKLTKNVNISCGYSSSNSENRSSSEFLSTNSTSDYFPMGEKGDKGFSIPTWTLRWSGLEKIPLFAKFANTVSLEHSFAGKQTRTGQEKPNEEGVPTWELTRLNYSTAFKPLIGMNFSLKKGISASARYSSSTSIANGFTPTESTNKTISSNISITANYSRRTGLRIPVFFLKDLNLDNQVSFSLTFDSGKSEELSRNEAGVDDFAVKDRRKNWKLSPQISYSFSTKVQGGIYFEIGKTENFLGGSNKFTDFGLHVNIAIKG